MLCAFLCAVLSLCPRSLQAGDGQRCGDTFAAHIDVDTEHRWRPPFGLDRVGAPLFVHARLTTAQAPAGDFYAAVFEGSRERTRLPLKFFRNGSSFVATAQLTTLPDEVALVAQCPGQKAASVLARQSVGWPVVEADAEAHAQQQINPVDLGAILVPHEWLLLTSSDRAILDVAAISRTRQLPNIRVRAWFDENQPVETEMPLAAGERSSRRLSVSFAGNTDRSILHVRILSDNAELWKKDIRTMIVATPARPPAFGAVATRLRYDAPISVHDPKTGQPLPSLEYDRAWDSRLRDVVVFLPNGSRFVFWRGASYAPFWAGIYNTGFSYQWAETIPPQGFTDAVEPLQDKELRYARVQIVESTVSRVHVRWTYQSVDFNYRSLGDNTAEDFYFYPDGFGTRVATLVSARPDEYVYSEFIVVAPQGAFPFEILPQPKVEMLSLDGRKRVLVFPFLPGTYERLSVGRPGGQHPVERLLGLALEYQGKKGEPFIVDLIDHGLGKIKEPAHEAVLYRILDNKADRATPIYFTPDPGNGTIVFLPFYDHGQLATPSYWGDHWPLGRGAMTGGAIDDRIYESPSHFSLMDLSEPDPILRGDSQTIDSFGHARRMRMERRVWLIAKTDLPDDVLLKWAESFAVPPPIDVKGARLDLPSFSEERRAFRLVVESSSVEIAVKPGTWCMNPVFELADAPKRLAAVTFDDRPLSKDDYAWDGATLWVRGAIDARGAKIRLTFQDAA
jgi:hypothetical protein